MFLKKKELDPDWTDNTFTWEFQGAKNKSWDIKDAKNYTGGFDPHVAIKDPSIHASIIPSVQQEAIRNNKNIQHERRIHQVLSEIQGNNEKGLRGALKGLGDKLFGEW